jgi:UDPglucose 6-dehydrogenase
VPVGTGDWVADIVKARQKTPVPFSVVSCPEFLREGSALTDFMNPDRIVLGSLDREAAESVAHLHLPLRTTLVVTDLRTAEMIKYASNAFLATKVSFINEIANICEALGADVKEVATGMGFDKRIGRHFLDAGLGWGGSCFPKDVKALAHMAHEKGRHPQLLRAVMDINADQRRDVVAKLKGVMGDLHGKTIALLGLAFKPNTDDMRDAPSVDIAHMLLSKGARVKGYDPVAMSVAARVLPTSVQLTANAYECARDADAVIIVTEWNEFKQLDLAQLKQVMKQPVIIDARNIYEPTQVKATDFTYRCFGRGYDGQG